MSEPLISIDTSEIREEKLEELKTAMARLAEFVETNEPRALAYEVYLSDDGRRVTVLQIHPDSASMEMHMAVAARAFPGFSQLLTLSAIDVYGRPSPRLVEQLQQKGRMLGNASVSVHELHAGFARIGAAEAPPTIAS